MATTTITGTINGVNNTALANKWITFRLVQLGTDSVATATVAQSVDSVQTDANGDFSIDVWNNGDSGKPSVLEITIDGSKPESVIIPAGTVSIELWDLIENEQADGSTSEQVPTTSDLFARKASNLGDLGNFPAARSNLGLGTAATTAATDYATAAQGVKADAAIPTSGIGSTVQAYASVLQSTTASYTTAAEAAISANTANISTNTDDIALNTAALSQLSTIAIIEDSTTARSLSLTDIGGYIRLTNASSCTITIPANATVDWAGETEPPAIYVRVAAAGIPTLSGAGVTINDTLGVIAALEEGSTFALQWVASNVWDII